MKGFIFFMLTAIVILFFICAYITFISEKKSKQKEEREHAEKTAKIITEASKTKADARTGDHSADIKYMADKLHDYAKK